MAQEHQTAALIGSPPGYVGFRDPEDPTGEHPLLTNWNIYKHHFEMLQAKYADLLNERGEFSDKLNELKNKRFKMIVRHQELHRSSLVIMEEVLELGEEMDDLLAAMELARRNAKKDKEEDEKDPKDLMENMDIPLFLEFLEKGRAKRKLLQEGEFQDNQAKTILGNLIAMQKESKELEAKLEKTDKEYYENGLDWDGSGDVPKNLIGIVLFDELEKAHRNAHHLLYQIIDKGKLRQSNGVWVNFENCVIIATGNVASEEIADVINNKALGFRTNNPRTKNELG